MRSYVYTDLRRTPLALLEDSILLRAAGVTLAGLGLGLLAVTGGVYSPFLLLGGGAVLVGFILPRFWFYLTVFLTLGVPVFGYKRLLFAVLILVTAPAFARQGRIYARYLVWWLVLAYLVVLLLSYLAGSVDPRLSNTLEVSAPVLFFFVVVSLLDSPERVLHLVGWIIACGVFLTLLRFFNSPELLGPAEDHVVLGVTLMTCLVFSTLLYVSHETSHDLPLLLASLAMAVAWMLALSKTTFVLAPILLGAGLLVREIRVKILYFLVVLAAVLFVLPLLLTPVLFVMPLDTVPTFHPVIRTIENTVLAIAEPEGTTWGGRLEDIRRAFNYWREHPGSLLTGVGLGSATVAISPTLWVPYDVEKPEFLTSGYVSLTLEAGLPALVLYLAVSLITLKHLLVLVGVFRRNGERKLLFLTFALLFNLLAVMIRNFQGPTYEDYFFWMIVGMTAVLHRLGTEGPAARPEERR